MYKPATGVLIAHCPAVPVTVTVPIAVVAAVPVVVRGIPTYSVDDVHENVPVTPVMATDESVVVSYVPEIAMG
jgi:hypothetical protein